jgi:Predicted sugar kinase
MQAWTEEDARGWIAVPGADDDKYSRGVLGVVTGSDAYPGAAVLGVEAAARTGVGMVRYLGDERAAFLVLRRRPEAVTVAGRVQAWLIGSGMDASQRDEATTRRLRGALHERVPVVVDAGALDLAREAAGPVVVTPHARELARLLGTLGITASVDEINGDPAMWAARAATELRVTVLLKGSTTHVVAPDGESFTAASATGWLATAGTGDVLGGVLGALVATHADAVSLDGHSALARLAATAAVLHGLAARRASAGGPIVALDVAEALPATISRLLS